MNLDEKKQSQKLGRHVLELEAQAILRASRHLDAKWDDAVEMISQCQGKLLVTGLGKSGHIGAKIASTMSSLGRPSLFLHASEALHGDFGVVEKNDCLLAIAFGGETREVIAVVRYCQKMRLPVLCITGHLSSTLAKLSDVVLNGNVEKEADELGLAPTSSSTVALAIGDALSVCVMDKRGFTRDGFASLHPGGKLGVSLKKVDALCRDISTLGCVKESSNFKLILDAIGKGNNGIAAIVDDHGTLLGCISDGDVRRCLKSFGKEALDLSAKQFMNTEPKAVFANTSLLDAVSLMERYSITNVFATDEHGRLVGLLRMNDLLAANIL